MTDTWKILENSALGVNGCDLLSSICRPAGHRIGGRKWLLQKASLAPRTYNVAEIFETAYFTSCDPAYICKQ
jgi:hypothetical protein